jgi:hypothetical protein
MSSPSTTRHADLDVHDRLTELGLTKEILLEAVGAGQLARDACTPLDPPATAGWNAYSRSTRSLRQSLLPQGWRQDNTKNHCTTVSPDGRIAIMVAAGDAATGISTMNPSTRNPKGDVTQHAVQSNQLQLFPSSVVAPVEIRKTWVLLTCTDAKEVRSELSMPETISDDGYIVTWNERIILPAIPIDHDADVEITPANENDALDITVVRKRRG